MSSPVNKMPTALRFASILFVIVWLTMAAFPFIWTFWGSFKVELDFFFNFRLDKCHNGETYLGNSWFAIYRRGV